MEKGGRFDFPDICQRHISNQESNDKGFNSKQWNFGGPIGVKSKYGKKLIIFWSTSLANSGNSPTSKLHNLNESPRDPIGGKGE
jgi:hypothetical protein